jgi:cephalosporin hydroxylase
VDPHEKFRAEVRQNIRGLEQDAAARALSKNWIRAVAPHRYVFNFSWLGRPIIQFPQDIVAVQELIWQVKPDLVIETGIAHGGSLLLSASMLALLDYCDAAEEGRPLDPRKPVRKVLGVDIDIREHNRAAIEAHPLCNHVEMMQGSSIAADIVAAVRERAKNARRVMVCLDSNHTHEHVLKELLAYAPLVTPGSYCVVSDTDIEDMPPGSFPDRPWDKGNNPKTAVWEYLKTHPEFEIDKSMEAKLLITVAPDGYLKRVK